MTAKATHPIKTRKVLFVDVMKDERFLFTMPYRYCPAFKIDLKDICDKVIEKRSSLKDKKFEIYIDEW